MRRLSLALPVLLLIGACTLGLSGIPNPADFFRVQPNYVCSGDSVEVRWTVAQVARSRAFCSTPDGGVSPRTTCSLDSECPIGAGCFDGLCVMSGIDRTGVDFGDGCYENISSTVSFVPGRISPTIVRGQSGRRSFPIDVTTRISFLVGGGSGGPSRPAPSKLVTVVPAEDEAPHRKTLDFGFPLCSSPSTPLSLDLTEETVNKTVGSADVRIRSVTNASPYDVVIETGDPRRGPVTLAPGAGTLALNGVTGRTWTVAPLISAPLDPNPAGCFQTPQGGRVTAPPASDGSPRLPPVQLLLEMSCTR